MHHELIDAIQAHDIPGITRFFEKNGPLYDDDVEKADDVRTTPLYLAIETGSAEVVDCLLQHGFAADIRDRRRRLFLVAVRKNYLDIVPLFIKAGADIMVEPRPLFFVDSVEMIRLLIAHGASVQDCDGEGGSVLHAAIFHENSHALIREFVRQGADVNSANNDGRTALMECVFDHASWDAPAALLECGATRFYDKNDEWAHSSLLYMLEESGKAHLIQTLASSRDYSPDTVKR